MAFEYQGFATLGVNLNRQKYGPLDISNVFTSQADLDYYLTKGASKDGVSDYWLNTVPYPYEGQVLATVIGGTVNVYALAAKEDGNFETQEIGGKVDVDGKTIKTDANGKLQLVGLEAVEAGKTYVPSLVNGVLTWAEPDTSTAEGQAQEINAIKTAAVGSVELNNEHNLVLKNLKGETIGDPVDTSIFVQDSFLDDVDYDASTGKVKFTWKMGDGSTKEDEIDLSGLVDTYTAGEGLKLTAGAFSVDTTKIATKESVDSHISDFDTYKAANDTKIAGIDTSIATIKTDLGKSTIAHAAEGVAEGITATGATLKIVVDAYTKAETDAAIDADVKVVNDVLTAYKTTNDEAVAAVKNDITALQGRVGATETDIGTLKTDVADVKEKAETNATDITNLSATVDKKANAADVYTKTATDTAIAEAVAAGAYDDTALTKKVDDEVLRAKAAEGANANAIATEKGRVDGLTTTVSGLNTKVETLVGEDVDKSVRAISAEEVAKIVADAPEDYDTLKEIAEYIASDKTGAATMSNDIAALKTKVDTGEQTVSAYVAAQIAGIPIATTTTLGLVKASTEITISEAGVLGLGAVSTDKLVQGTMPLVLNGNA